MRVILQIWKEMYILLIKHKTNSVYSLAPFGR